MADHVFYPLLKISNSIELQKFLHECIDDLVEKRKIKFDYYNTSPIEWTEDDFHNAKKSVQAFYKQCTIKKRFEISPDDIAEDVKEALRCCFDIRKQEIFQFLAKMYIIKGGNIFIENIDWRLRWVLGSSDLITLKEPYLQIDFNGIKDNSGHTENTFVSFEATLEQVDQLIMELKHLKTELSELLN
ncbi:uncharacterized protein LOC130901164 [Diorhabda carinulata]|uniref:uncharacterized protein LOC130901164 n=1 Tax=Diorhabda carinulata TaxID=1163345 RepID=UPI0025A225E5|nr:uncharacterized protein LOC130901164 [Diorhabda carinulata]